MSLGDELRSVFDAEDSDGEKEKGKTVVRTVTYRTERVSNRLLLRDIADVLQVIHHRKKESPEDNDSEPETSFVEEIVREYTDAGVATDPEVPTMPVMTSSSIQTDETHQGTLPPYSPRSDAEIASEALAHAHPALEVTEDVDLQRHGELALKYAEMTMGAGLRCTVLEEKLQLKQDQAMRVQGGVLRCLIRDRELMECFQGSDPADGSPLLRHPACRSGHFCIFPRRCLQSVSPDTIVSPVSPFLGTC